MTNCKKVMNYQYSESDGMNESFETRPALPVILVLAWHKKASERWSHKVVQEPVDENGIGLQIKKQMQAWT